MIVRIDLSNYEEKKTEISICGLKYKLHMMMMTKCSLKVFPNMTV